jgi:hypothetical protein
MNFSPNCPTRAFTDVLLMIPKVGEVELLSGFDSVVLKGTGSFAGRSGLAFLALFVQSGNW